MAFPDPLSLVGTTVSDKYDVERVVGEGGFAIVYRATHRVWKRPVAIKVFRALGSLPPEHREQLVKSFIQEGALLAELSERSAAIVQARDVGMLSMSDGREMPYMVLEWLEGRSLEEVLRAERAASLPPRTADEALAILEPAALALALAHRRGIAHRDVKPANLFVIGDPRGDFTVKLLDFGIAKVVQDLQREAGAFQETQGGVTSFTPAYGAPEQFSRSHGPTGPWTDVFALALIFTELMTQDAPLRGDDLTQLAFCSMDPTQRPTPRAYGHAIPDALEVVLRRALAVSQDERYRSASELWNALRDALALETNQKFATTSPHGAFGSAPALETPSGSRSSGRTVAHAAPQATRSGTALLPVGAGSASVGPSGPALPAAVATPSRGPLGATGEHGSFEKASPARAIATGGASPSTLKLFLAFGGAAVVATVLVGVGVWTFAIRSADRSASLPASADASSTTGLGASSASASAAAPAPRCPEGMILVPGGKFFMGSDEASATEAERPAHQVTLAAYCIDATEVTVRQYKACSDEGECKRAPRENDWPGITAREHKIYDPLCTIRDPVVNADHPINCVDWALADAFCKATGRALPTEAEWEFATRGSDGRKYPWGDEPPMTGALLNACGKECLAWAKKNGEDVRAMYGADDGFATLAPVGSFPKGASQFGLQDVVGNVWEWASDWYAPYAAEPQIDPPGASKGSERVLRGGAWNGGDPAWVAPSYRFKSMPTLRSHGIGFRCAKRL